MSAPQVSDGIACGRSSSTPSRFPRTRIRGSARGRSVSSRPAIAPRTSSPVGSASPASTSSPPRADGSQFGFCALDGRFRGHIDGCIASGPVPIAYPAPLGDEGPRGVELEGRGEAGRQHRSPRLRGADRSLPGLHGPAEPRALHSPQSRQHGASRRARPVRRAPCTGDVGPGRCCGAGVGGSRMAPSRCGGPHRRSLPRRDGRRQMACTLSLGDPLLGDPSMIPDAYELKRIMRTHRNRFLVASSSRGSSSSRRSGASRDQAMFRLRRGRCGGAAIRGRQAAAAASRRHLRAARPWSRLPLAVRLRPAASRRHRRRLAGAPAQSPPMDGRPCRFRDLPTGASGTSRDIPRLTEEEFGQYADAATGLTWRALAILATAAEVAERQIKPVFSLPAFSREGVARVWTYGTSSPSASGAGASAAARSRSGGIHARPPMAHSPPAMAD